MATYHFHLSSYGRSKGANPVAAAAYRARTKLVDPQGKTHNFSKRPDLEYEGIFWGEGSAPITRQELWVKCDQSEKRKDARVFHEIQIALPLEASAEEKQQLVQELAQSLSQRYSAPVDVVIHNPGHNPHAHIMLPARPWKLNEEGQLEPQQTKQNCNLRLLCSKQSREEIKLLRSEWEETLNHFIQHLNSRRRQQDQIAEVSCQKRATSKKHLPRWLFETIRIAEQDPDIQAAIEKALPLPKTRETAKQVALPPKTRTTVNQVAPLPKIRETAKQVAPLPKARTMVNQVASLPKARETENQVAGPLEQTAPLLKEVPPPLEQVNQQVDQQVSNQTAPPLKQTARRLRKKSKQRQKKVDFDFELD